MTKRIFLNILIFVISFAVFLWLESGFTIKHWDIIGKVFIFSSSLVITFHIVLRRYLLIATLLFLGIMVFLYLLWKIPLADWFGSTGFGLLMIYVVGLLPELIRKGYVEKL